MTHTEFVAECLTRNISPDVAFESDEIREALRDRDYRRVCKILDEEF